MGAAAAMTAAGVALPDLVKYPDLGVLPRVIRNLVLRRRQVKGLLSKETDPARRQALDIRQQVRRLDFSLASGSAALTAAASRCRRQRPRSFASLVILPSFS